MKTRVSTHHRLALAALVLLLAIPAGAQDWAGKARVNGKIVDGEGNPVEGATVSIFLPDQPGVGPAPLTTDKKGRWSYLGLMTGGFTVLFEKEGYISHEMPLRANEFQPGPPIMTTLAEIPEEVLMAQAAGRANAFLDEANAMFETNDYAGARAKLNEALSELEDPASHPPVLMAIARSHYGEDDIDAAIATLEKALAIEPDNVGALKLVSNLLVSEGRQEEAQSYLDRLPQGEGLDPDAYLNMGIDHYNGGDMEAALIEFEKTVSLYPDNAEGYYYRALVYMSQGRNEESLADFKKHMELDPNSSHTADVEQFMGYLEPN